MRCFKRLFLMVTVTILSIISVSETVKADQYAGGIVINDDGEGEVIQEGLMPSTGNVKALVFMVDFPDCKAQDGHDKAYVENMFFGGEDSMSEFYTNSSYGKLNVWGEVYGWYTAEHDREYYARTDLEYPPTENLYNEVIIAYDDVIDYSQYDSDNDGYVDAVYIYYAGQDSGYGSAWWMYVDNSLYANPMPDGMNISQFGFINEYADYITISHETGHMLGLMDYYDTNNNWNGTLYFGGQSLMCNNMGDLDGLSKILLGWVNPIEVTQNMEINLRPINEYPDAAVIYPGGDTTRKEFFIVEYQTITKNNRLSFDEEVNGLCVYRVNLNTDAEGFIYVVSDADVDMIQIIAQGIEETGSEITPYTSPATYVVKEDENNNVIWEYTGINIKNMNVIDEGKASFTVSYDLEPDKAMFKYEIKEMVADNSLYFKISCNTDVMPAEDAGAYIISEDGTKTFIPIVRLNDNDVHNKTDFYVFLRDSSLERAEKYTIEIQENVFATGYGAVNEKISFEIQTEDYPEITEYLTGNGQIGRITDMFEFDESHYTYFSYNEAGEVYQIIKSIDGDAINNKLFTAPEGGCIKACQLESGEYIIKWTNNSVANFYKIYKDGTYVMIVEDVDSRFMGDCYSFGNKGIIPAYDNVFYLINEDNTFVEEVCEGGHYGSWYGPFKLEDNLYAIQKTVSGEFAVFNTDFEVVGNINCEGAINFFNAFLYDEYYAIVGYSSDYGTSVWYFDKNLSFVKRETIYDIGGGNGSNFVKTEKGFVYTFSDYMPLTTGEGSSPIARIVCMDKDFNVMYTYTVDYNGEGNGDEILSIVELDNNKLVAISDWCEYVLHDAFPIRLNSPGILMLSKDRNQVVAGMVVESSQPTDIQYRWTAYNKTTQVTEVVQEWTDNNEWLNWSPSTFGEYELTAEARVKSDPDTVVSSTSEAFEYNPHIKGKCQMPYWGEGGGYLIGVESYENPNQSYQYEMLILDCTLLAEGKPAWVYTTNKFTVTEGAAGWCVWQPQYGYYWTLFRVYDAEGNMIDQACYPFVNAY